MFLLMLSLVYAAKNDDKEDSCYLLASHLIRERMDEISDFMFERKHLREPEVRMKIIEDSFYHCLSLITDEQARDIANNDRKEYTKYKKLVDIPIGDYKSIQDTKTSKEFKKLVSTISKRKSFTKKRRDL